MAKIIIGQCDCCGKALRYLHSLVYSGMDTAACSECCDGDREEDNAEVREEIARLLPSAETGEQFARICELECALV